MRAQSAPCDGDTLKIERLPRRLLIVGASARAAAYSAWRDGFEPFACDLFADADLRRLCSCRPMRQYPAGLVNAASQQPASPFLYTGGLENHPAIVDRIARDRPLLGNPGKVLRAVRDPGRLAAALKSHGLPAPCCEPLGAAVAIDGRWLLKRRASAGGAGVRPGTAGFRGWRRLASITFSSASQGGPARACMSPPEGRPHSWASRSSLSGPLGVAAGVFNTVAPWGRCGCHLPRWTASAGLATVWRPSFA